MPAVILGDEVEVGGGAAAEPVAQAVMGVVHARHQGVGDGAGDEVRLELVNKTRMNGKSEVRKYFGNYSLVEDWQLVPGFVDRVSAILVCDPRDASGAPTYFVLLDWVGDRIIGIRDFRHARYATDGADLLMLG